MRLPKDFFSYYSFGLPTHFVSILQLSLIHILDNYSDYLLLWSPRDKKLWYLDNEHCLFYTSPCRMPRPDR